MFDKLGSRPNDKFPLLSYKWHQVIYNFRIEAALINGFILQYKVNSKYTQQRIRLGSHIFTSGK